MILESDVRAKLAAVANHELSVEDFEEWIDVESWNMHADSSSGAIELVSSIHLLFSEYGYGLLHEAELRRRLMSLLDNMSLEVHISIDFKASVRALPSYGASPSQIVHVPEMPVLIQVPA